MWVFCTYTLNLGAQIYQGDLGKIACLHARRNLEVKKTAQMLTANMVMTNLDQAYAAFATNSPSQGKYNNFLQNFQSIVNFEPGVSQTWLYYFQFYVHYIYFISSLFLTMVDQEIEILVV